MGRSAHWNEYLVVLLTVPEAQGATKLWHAAASVYFLETDSLRSLQILAPRPTPGQRCHNLLWPTGKSNYLARASLLLPLTPIGICESKSSKSGFREESAQGKGCARWEKAKCQGSLRTSPVNKMALDLGKAERTQPEHGCLHQRYSWQQFIL